MDKKRKRGRPPKYDKPLDYQYTLRVTPEFRDAFNSSGTADIWRDRMLLLASDPELLAYVDQHLLTAKKEDAREQT